jgi:hypothetical protein
MEFIKRRRGGQKTNAERKFVKGWEKIEEKLFFYLL